MNTTDSLIQVMDTIRTVTEATNGTPSGDSHQWAYWLGGLLAAGVIALGVLKRRNTEQEKLRKKMKSGNVDFDSVINSAFHSQEMYDMLIRKCHPDRFSTQPELVKKADEISKLIVANKFNHQALLELKEMAEKELGIHF